MRPLERVKKRAICFAISFSKAKRQRHAHQMQEENMLQYQMTVNKDLSQNIVTNVTREDIQGGGHSFYMCFMFPLKLNVGIKATAFVERTKK